MFYAHFFRVFQNSLLSGQCLALAKRRLLVYYVEEKVQNPSIETTEYRHALSDSTIGDILNERVQPVFFNTSVCRTSLNTLLSNFNTVHIHDKHRRPPVCRPGTPSSI